MTAGFARRFLIQGNKKGRIAAAFREIDISKFESKKNNAPSSLSDPRFSLIS
jgi:hypothetical protein